MNDKPEISKREFMATHILSALIGYVDDQNVPNDPNIGGNVILAVKATDWLIEELNKKP